MEWIKTKDDMPPFGTIVLAYSKEWVDEDYNPEGIREAFLNDSGEINDWASAEWNNEQDCFDTDWDTKPTHWMQRPEPPIK